MVSNKCQTNVKAQASIEFIVSALIIIIFFVFSIALFSDRLDVVQSANNQWSAREVAYKISRNINSLALVDGNASTSTYIYWNLVGQEVTYSDGKILVFWQEGSFVDSLVYASQVNWDVTDLNGLIFFKKQNGVISVSYE